MTFPIEGGPRYGVIIGVGAFLGMGEKDVAAPFSSVRASEKNNKWYWFSTRTRRL
jgi:hypothetical protein